MSLNRYEQALFDYWERNPDERRHWQAKIVAVTRGMAQPVEAARGLERELWEHLAERSEHVPALRGMARSRVSLLNLAEYLLRLWGPVPKPRQRPPEPSP
jgi:hypothetical protein